MSIDRKDRERKLMTPCLWLWWRVGKRTNTIKNSSYHNVYAMIWLLAGIMDIARKESSSLILFGLAIANSSNVEYSFLVLTLLT